MTPDSTETPTIRAVLRAKHAYLHLVFAYLPTPPDSTTARFISDFEAWLGSCPNTEFSERAAELEASMDKMIALAQKRLPPRKPWQEIAAEYLRHTAGGDFSLSAGIPYGWLAERFDSAALGGPPDLPYHARVGIGPHSGRAAVEEDFLLRDAYFLLGKSNRSLTHLESFRSQRVALDSRAQYRTISTANENVATYARFTVSGFYAFVECLVNSVGEDFVLRNPTVSDVTKGLLRGKKDGRYLSIEKKIELFPGLIRPDGKRPIVLSDPQQIDEPYRAFVSHIKDVRDASAHYAKSKADILMSPQLWNKKANEAAAVCVAVARGFWTACYPNRSLPLYLGKLDDAQHAKRAEARIESEMSANPETHAPKKS